MIRSPVLFLTFNRFDTTERVFEAIRQAKPPRIYLASDGPRESRPSESDQVHRIREFMTSGIDWPCEVNCLFREKNLGCKLAVSQAITWFFEHEESGIILEDDCLPHQDFFGFADELLDLYRNESSIFSISGTNIKSSIESESSYLFSAFGGIWGWASWRRAWSQYTLDVKPKFNDEIWKSIHKHIGSKRLSDSIRFILKQSLIDSNPTTWDYQWLFASLAAGGKSIIPKANLVTNIGFGAQSTHTFDASNPLANLPTYPLTKPLQHPSNTNLDLSYDTFHVSFYNANLLARLKYAIKTLLLRKKTCSPS